MLMTLHLDLGNDSGAPPVVDCCLQNYSSTMVDQRIELIVENETSLTHHSCVVVSEAQEAGLRLCVCVWEEMAAI